MFTITRIYSDANGDSRFEDIQISLEDAGDIGFLSTKHAASGIIFREVKPTYDYNFHNAPQRQYIILLDGGIEIETSLGEKRIFKTGEVLLAEDITGKGHRSKNIDNRIRKSLFIPL